MNTDTPISELTAILDRLNDPAPRDLLREIQTELEYWIARHSSESRENG